MSVDYSQYAPRFEVILLGKGKSGKSDPAFQHNIISVTLQESLDSTAQFQITVNDKFDADKQEFIWFDNPKLQPGNKISLKMGYEKLVNMLPAGNIDNIRTSGFTQGSPQMTIAGTDKTKEMLRTNPNSDDGTINQILTGTELLKTIAPKFDLDVEVDSAENEIPTRITNNPFQTYGSILSEQARSIGCTYFISRGKCHFINPRKSKGSSHTYEWGKNIKSFAPSINVSGVRPSMGVRSSSPTSREPFVSQAGQGSEETLDSDGSTASSVAVSIGAQHQDIIEICSNREEVDTRAQSHLNNMGDNLLTCSVVVVGNPEIDVGQIIDFKGLGKRFSGKYFVKDVTNTISSSGYETRFTVRKNTVKGI